MSASRSDELAPAGDTLVDTTYKAFAKLSLQQIREVEKILPTEFQRQIKGAEARATTTVVQQVGL